LIKLGEQAGDAIMLQLVTERTVNISRKPASADDLASFRHQLFF
jgi:hypothetical protein